jgi:hypothetical protein
MAFASSVHNNRDSLVDIFIFSLIVSQALLVSSSASKSSKAIWDFKTILFFTLYHVLFPEIESIHMNSVCCLFTACQPLPNFCHHQIVASITNCHPEWLDIKYTWMLSPIYRNIVNFVVSLSIRRCSSKFMNVTIWELCTFDSQIFGCVKFYYYNSIIITNFVQTLIPSCWFENIFPAYFEIESNTMSASCWSGNYHVGSTPCDKPGHLNSGIPILCTHYRSWFNARNKFCFQGDRERSIAHLHYINMLSRWYCWVTAIKLLHFLCHWTIITHWLTVNATLFICIISQHVIWYDTNKGCCVDGEWRK